MGFLIFINLMMSKQQVKGIPAPPKCGESSTILTYLLKHPNAILTQRVFEQFFELELTNQKITYCKVRLKLESQITTICHFINNKFNLAQCYRFLKTRIKTCNSSFLQIFCIMIYLRRMATNKLGLQLKNQQARPAKMNNSEQNIGASQMQQQSNEIFSSDIISNESASEVENQQGIPPIAYLNSQELQQGISQIQEIGQIREQPSDGNSNDSNSTFTAQKTLNQSHHELKLQQLRKQVGRLIQKNYQLIKGRILPVLQKYQSFEYLKLFQTFCQWNYKSYNNEDIQSEAQEAYNFFLSIKPKLSQANKTLSKQLQDSQSIFQPQVYFYIVKKYRDYKKDLAEFEKEILSIFQKPKQKQKNPFIVDFKELYQLNPISFTSIGTYELKNKNHAKMLFYLSLGLKIRPNDMRIKLLFAKGLAQIRELQRAAELYSCLIKVLLTQIQVQKQKGIRLACMYELASVEAKLGRKQKAQEHFMQSKMLIQKRCKENQPLKNSQNWSNLNPMSSYHLEEQIEVGLAMSQFYCHNYQQALDQLYKIGFTNSQNIVIRLVFQAICQFKTNNIDKCKCSLQKALELLGKYFSKIDPLEYLAFFKEMVESCSFSKQIRLGIEQLINKAVSFLRHKASQLAQFALLLFQREDYENAHLILNYLKSHLHTYIINKQYLEKIFQKCELKLLTSQKIKSLSLTELLALRDQLKEAKEIDAPLIHALITSFKQSQTPQFDIQNWLDSLPYKSLTKQEILDLTRIQIGDIYKKWKDYQMALKYYQMGASEKISEPVLKKILQKDQISKLFIKAGGLFTQRCEWLREALRVVKNKQDLQYELILSRSYYQFLLQRSLTNKCSLQLQQQVAQAFLDYLKVFTKKLSACPKKQLALKLAGLSLKANSKQSLKVSLKYIIELTSLNEMQKLLQEISKYYQLGSLNTPLKTPQIVDFLDKQLDVFSQQIKQDKLLQFFCKFGDQERFVNTFKKIVGKIKSFQRQNDKKFQIKKLGMIFDILSKISDKNPLIIILKSIFERMQKKIVQNRAKVSCKNQILLQYLNKLSQTNQNYILQNLYTSQQPSNNQESQKAKTIFKLE